MGFLDKIEKVIKVKEKDKGQSIVLLILAIIGILFGVAILASLVKVSDSFPITGNLLGWLLVGFGTISLVYSILVLSIIYKKSKNNAS